MPKKSKKSVSKRMSSKDKFKIVRKVKEHNRKKRKEAKKSGKRGKASLLKDPGIPSNFPFREQVVKEFKFEKDRIAAKDAAKKEARRARRLALQEGAPDDEELAGGDEGDEDMAVDTAAQLAAISAAAAAAQQQHADRAASGAHASPSGAFQDGSRKAFYKEFKKVVELSDVIIQVLDARDPLATRCADVERYVRSVGTGKKIVLVLNKIDLVPRDVAEAWLKYFRQELPTVAFKAATKRSGTIAHARLPSAKGAAPTPATAECLGADSLLQLLKNYVHATGAKVAVTVGVIGPPNVGKSSIINSLKRSKVAAVGNTPGVTTGVQEVHLDKHLRLVDSPGVVFSAAADAAEAALRNCVKVEKIEDPVAAVAAIVRRVPAKCLMHVYTAPAFSGAEALLTHIAAARGKLRKGGIPDLPAAARLVIQDWNDGRIPYYTRPPSRGNEGHEAAALVATMAAEFDVDKVYAAEASAVIAGLQDDAAAAFAEAQPGAAAQVDFAALEDEAGAGAVAARADGSDSDMDDEPPRKQAGAAAQAQPARDAVLYSAQGQHNPKAARAAKRAARKKKAAGEEAFDFGVLDGDEGMAE